MDFFNISTHLAEFSIQYGHWVYVILFLIVFCETGLVLLPFLPGDSLLFMVGALAAKETSFFNIYKMLLLISIAAILGDTCNYLIGKFFGKKLFRNPNSLIFKQSYLKNTHDFYKKHGKKTILFARFVPIVRTFAPFVAGIGQMNYTHFFIYNTIGGIFWVILFLHIGYFFGQSNFIKNHLSLLIIILVFISLLPGIIEILIKQRNNKK